MIDELKSRLSLYTNPEDLPYIVNDILDVTGYDTLLEEMEDGEDRLKNVKEIQQDIEAALSQEGVETLDDYLQQVTLLSEKNELDQNPDVVTLMTVHAAKGTEFPVVVLAGLNDGIFPNDRAISESGSAGLEEERRLMYVAMTRAKEHLYLSWNHGFSYQTGHAKMPSRFLDEIPEESEEKKEEKKAQKKSAASKAAPSSTQASTGANRAAAQRTSSSQPKTDPVKSARTLDARRRQTSKKSKVRPGTIVSHPMFGQGVVLEANGFIITVQFGSAFGTKKISKDYLTFQGQDQ